MGKALDKTKYGSETIDGSSQLGYHGFTKGEGDMGKANVQALQSTFKDSPLIGYSPEGKTATSADYKAWFFANVVNGTVSDSAYGLNNFSLDYLGTDTQHGPPDLPKLDKEHTKHDLASAWVPNPTSPGEGNGDNASEKGNVSPAFRAKLRKNSAFGTQESLADPIKASAENKLPAEAKSIVV